MTGNDDIIDSDGGQPKIQPDMAAIRYGERVFGLPMETLFELMDTPRYFGRMNRRMRDNGIILAYDDGASGCMYCSHYNHSPTFHKTAEGIQFATESIQGEYLIRIKGCDYIRMEDVLLAFELRKGESLEKKMAVMTPCVMYDSKIAALIDAGALKEYEREDASFSYPKVCELNDWPELEEKYGLVIREQGGIIGMVRGLFQKWKGKSGDRSIEDKLD